MSKIDFQAIWNPTQSTHIARKRDGDGEIMRLIAYSIRKDQQPISSLHHPESLWKNKSRNLRPQNPLLLRKNDLKKCGNKQTPLLGLTFYFRRNYKNLKNAGQAILFCSLLFGVRPSNKPSVSSCLPLQNVFNVPRLNKVTIGGINRAKRQKKHSSSKISQLGKEREKKKSSQDPKLYFVN